MCVGCQAKPLQLCVCCRLSDRATTVVCVLVVRQSHYSCVCVVGCQAEPLQLCVCWLSGQATTVVCVLVVRQSHYSCVCVGCQAEPLQLCVCCRLLREMGWNDDEEEYVITEDDLREFQKLKQVQVLSFSFSIIFAAGICEEYLEFVFLK